MNMFSYYLHRRAPGNVATWDRVLRAVPGAVTLVLWATGLIGGAIALGLGVVSAMLFATSATGKCSIYYATRTGTRRDESGQRISGRV